MGTGARTPMTPAGVRAYVASGMVTAVVGALAWILVMRPGPVEAVLDLVCPMVVLLLIFGFALVANGKEWRDAVLSRRK